VDCAGCAVTEVVTIGGATLYLGDCMEVLPTLGRFDAVITDPPYGIADEHLKPGISGEWSKLYKSKIMWDSFAPQDAVVLAIGIAGNSVVWGGNYFDLEPKRGWLIWDKMQSHSSGHAELAWTDLDIPIRNFSYSRAQLAGEGKQHPTQKPVGLMAWCIEFLPDAKTILDPFMGSGTTGVACVQLGRKFTGIERERKYFDIACERISRAQAQGQMFPPEQVKQVQETFL
jgi:DNA modification methylase